MNYSAGIYQGGSEGPRRWGIFCAQTETWIFATKRGRKAAETRAKELNDHHGNAMRDVASPKRKFRTYYLTSMKVVEARTEHEAATIAAAAWNTTAKAVKAIMIPY